MQIFLRVWRYSADQPPKLRVDLFNCILRQHNGRDAIVNAFES